MGRIRSLDSLRGIAALIVMIYHAIRCVPGFDDRLYAVTPLRIFLAGPTAVVVFFVLSGFVLYLSLQRHDRDDYLTFAARRLFRLWPPVAVAILLSTGLYLMLARELPADASDWVTRYSWNEPLGPELLAGHLLLLDPDRFHTLNNPIWSLVVEVRLSLLFPFVAAGVRRSPAATLAVCIATSWMCRHVLASGHTVLPVDPFLTLQYLDLFAVGAAMARYAEPLSALVRRVPAWLVVPIMLVALCEPNYHPPYAMYVASILLVAISLAYPRLARFYALKPLVWLGERSFSLYLVHVPILLAVIHAFAATMPLALLLPGAVVTALLVAELFWLAVERPSMQLSRIVGRRLAQRRALRQG